MQFPVATAKSFVYFENWLKSRSSIARIAKLWKHFILCSPVSRNLLFRVSTFLEITLSWPLQYWVSVLLSNHCNYSNYNLILLKKKPCQKHLISSLFGLNFKGFLKDLEARIVYYCLRIVVYEYVSGNVQIFTAFELSWDQINESHTPMGAWLDPIFSGFPLLLFSLLDTNMSCSLSTLQSFPFLAGRDDSGVGTDQFPFTLDFLLYPLLPSKST